MLARQIPQILAILYHLPSAKAEVASIRRNSRSSATSTKLRLQQEDEKPPISIFQPKLPNLLFNILQRLRFPPKHDHRRLPRETRKVHDPRDLPFAERP